MVDLRSTTAAPVEHPYPYVAVTRPETNGTATTGGVLGIVALPVSLIPLIGWLFGIPLGILAVVFGAIGMSRSGKMGGLGRSMAISGLVLGITTLALKIIGLLVPVLFFL